MFVRNLLISAAAGVFLALIGAMGTIEMPLWLRLVYWIPLMIGGALVGHVIVIAVSLIPLARRTPWLFGAVQTLFMSVPITGIVWAWGRIILGTELPLQNLPYLFGAVLVITGAMTAILMAASPGAVTHAPAEGAAPVTVRFLERLPAKIKGGVLYAVSAEDHYLRLHTSKGSDLILMRLSDAIAELEGLEGAQTHRSWWVAKGAVESTRRDGDKTMLVLKGGAEAPVSRPNVRPLREAGWF